MNQFYSTSSFTDENHTPRTFGGWILAVPAAVIGFGVSTATGRDVTRRYFSIAAREGDKNNHHIVEGFAMVLKRGRHHG